MNPPKKICLKEAPAKGRNGKHLGARSDREDPKRVRAMSSGGTRSPALSQVPSQTKPARPAPVNAIFSSNIDASLEKKASRHFQRLSDHKLAS
jgi:hypothetical protein